jgi:2-methylfumaryl-CoA hydratase
MSRARSPGNCFEDFELGQRFRHGTPRTVSDGEVAVYTSLTGSREAAASATTTARLCGLPARSLNDWLVFNIAFGKTVADISQNALANLGYAEVRFLRPVFSGATLRCESLIIGMREISHGSAGIVYVRSTCLDENEQPVLSWIRWVMLPKRTVGAWSGAPVLPQLLTVVPAELVSTTAHFATAGALEDWCAATASRRVWDDYEIGTRIDHPGGMTIEAADHMGAARLYQNNAQVHFVAVSRPDSKNAGRRLVYGGHVISVCYALSYTGLENRVHVAAVNSGRHTAPVFAGDVLYAMSKVVDRVAIPDRSDIGLLRIRLIGLKNIAAEDFDLESSGHPAIVLELDHSVVMPRRQPGSAN